MSEKMQEYKLVLKRDTNGVWWLTGYWNIAPLNKHSEWDLDGKPLAFVTRKEALEFMLHMSGVPD